MGIAYMASHLATRNYQVHYVTATIEPMFFPKIELDLKRYIQERFDSKVDLFCFSLLAVHWAWAREKITELKRLFPEIPILVGGPFPTTSPEVILAFPGVDYVCCGDGEEPLMAMAESLEKGTLPQDVPGIPNISYHEAGKPVIKPMSFQAVDLDDYPMPDVTIFEGQLRKSFFINASLITSRGCPFSCTYCSGPTLMEEYKKIGKYVRQHSVPYTIEFLRKFKERYGTKRINFNDDVFFLNKKWLREFAPEYKKHVNLPMICLGNPNSFNREVGDLLKEASCELVIFGLQSGNEEVRRQIGRKETNERVLKMGQDLHDADLHFSINHIFDFPFDALDNIYESAKLYNELRPNLLDTFSLIYFPKAKITNNAVEMGFLSDHDQQRIDSGDLSGKINSYDHSSDSNYKKYNFFFNVLPLLPKRLVHHFLETPERFERVSQAFSKIPGIFSAFAKLMAAIKNGTGHIQLSIFGDLMFYFGKRFFSDKLYRLP